MREVWVVSAVRTPIGRFGGALKDFSPVDLGAHVMKAALEQAGLSGAELDLFVFGQVLRAGHGQLPPRQAAFKAGIPNTVDGYAVDMVCASGMQAVANGALAIKNGDAELVLAGGMESMTQTGFYLSSRARWGYKYLAGAPEQLQDILQRDGLSDPFTGEAMGDQTERLAAEFGVTRPELDEVALESHRGPPGPRRPAILAGRWCPSRSRPARGSSGSRRTKGCGPRPPSSRWRPCARPSRRTGC
ncbi:MAG: hypothetical protein KatS3mg071_0424 [Meiothermus sp.]|nr:MAG: hypothetical protein KatS3mg071_0424 [Meiothermus sp.]